MKFTEEQIQQLAAIFDDVITSDSAAVQSAFQRMALLSSLARDDDSEPGPFSTLLKRLDWAEHELKDLRREVQILQGDGKFTFTGGEPVVIDLSQNMASQSYSSGVLDPQVYASSAVDVFLSDFSINPLNLQAITIDPKSTT